MRSEAIALDGGFADPVLDAQTVFRTVMDAMAQPATVIDVKPLVAPPAPLLPLAGAIACTLADADTPLWLDLALSRNEAVREWLVFHTGARIMDRAVDAAFALIGNAAALPELNAFDQGAQEYPDRSATLIIAIEAFNGGVPLTFHGPGIRGAATIAPRGLPDGFTDQWEENTRRFPRGVDLMLVAGSSIACLPRSARLAARGI